LVQSTFGVATTVHIPPKQPPAGVRVGTDVVDGGGVRVGADVGGGVFVGVTPDVGVGVDGIVGGVGGGVNEPRLQPEAAVWSATNPPATLHKPVQKNVCCNVNSLLLHPRSRVFVWVPLLLIW
jgi:hypothetical protein